MVEAEVAALRRAGFDVDVVDARTDDLSRHPLYPVASALQVATGRGRDPLRALAELSPDVVHVHNLFPNFSRRWVGDHVGPLVHTLHNYRPLCANAFLLRDGAVCTRCPDGDRWSGFRYACYRDSRLATLPLTLAGRRGAADDPLLARADVLVALSERQRDLYRGAGLQSKRFETWPNFLPDALDPGATTTMPDEPAWLFVGRLSEEKGIGRLVRAWPPGHRLVIVGDGPLRAEVAARTTGTAIELRPPLSRVEVLELMGQSLGLIVPSLWFEVAPLVHLEALAAGLPTLAFRPTVVADAVQRAGTGDVATWGEDLGRRLDEAADAFPALRMRCRSVFEESHTERAYVRRARRLYTELAAG